MVNLRAREAEHAAKMFARQKVLDESKADEVFFEASSSTNKEVANILDDAPSQTEKTKVETKVTIDDAAWGEDDDLDIDDEINANAGGDDMLDDGSGAADNDIFVPPSPGADPVQALLRQNPQNAALHAAAGEFRKAAELLKSQLAVSNFALLKQHFVDAYTLNKAKI